MRTSCQASRGSVGALCYGAKTSDDVLNAAQVHTVQKKRKKAAGPTQPRFAAIQVRGACQHFTNETSALHHEHPPHHLLLHAPAQLSTPTSHTTVFPFCSPPSSSSMTPTALLRRCVAAWRPSSTRCTHWQPTGFRYPEAQHREIQRSNDNDDVFEQAHQCVPPPHFPPLPPWLIVGRCSPVAVGSFLPFHSGTASAQKPPPPLPCHSKQRVNNAVLIRF